MFHRTAHRRGFTLVELMIVVAVIGIGGTVAVVNMAEQVSESRARADGQTMLQRIRQEQRASKERMTGLLIHATGDGSAKNTVVFEDADNCRVILGGKTHSVTFAATTSLNIDGMPNLCWDARGVPSDGRAIEDEPGGVQLPNNPNPDQSNMVTIVLTNTFNITAGIKQIVTIPVYVSQTGLTSVAPITESDAVRPQGGPPPLGQ